jgi:uncharacterized membrane protein YgcG
MEIDDKIQLANQEVQVVQCEKCGALMVNIDANQIELGDMRILKLAGVRISNPDTEDKICLNCEVMIRPSFREKVKHYYEHDDADDSSLFHHESDDSGTHIGFGGSFGGFGGGIFGGAGASRGF